MNTKQIDVSIKNILNSDHPNAQLWRSILSYSRKVFNSFNSNFDITTIGKWLLTNHVPYRKEYETSHIPKNYRLQSKRTTIKDRLHELHTLGLILRVGKIKSQKNESLKELYAFTEDGYFFAWAIEAKYQQNQKDKISAIIEMIETLQIYYFDEFHSSLSKVFSHFLRKCIANLRRDDSLIRSMGFVQKILPDITRTLENNHTMLIAITEDKTLSKIFVDVIEELDEESRRIVFFQIKSDIESSISATLNVTREWENARYNNASYYNKITTLQYCDRCENRTPHKVDLIDFLRYDRVDALVRGNKFHCGKCGKINIVVLHKLCYELWYKK